MKSLVIVDFLLDHCRDAFHVFLRFIYGNLAAAGELESPSHGFRDQRTNQLCYAARCYLVSSDVNGVSADTVITRS